MAARAPAGSARAARMSRPSGNGVSPSTTNDFAALARLFWQLLRGHSARESCCLQWRRLLQERRLSSQGGWVGRRIVVAARLSLARSFTPEGDTLRRSAL